MRKPPQPSRIATARSARAAGAARKTAGRKPRVALPVDCMLAEAENLKLRLSRVLRNASAVTLDVSSVQRIDSACMQLLAAFVRDRAASQLAVGVSGDSSAFAEALTLSGLAPLFASAAP
jgi:ABC-type transporter Mla MlaB component